ncbi:MAG: septation protein IspZ [Burkholderiales bacterium]|nr:septation protein IspZ [Burkholderiales bacterium]
MNIWTYRRPFSAQGENFIVLIEAGFTGWRSRLMIGHQELVRDETILLGAAFDCRNHRLCHTLPDGSQLEVEIGYLNWFNTGIRVSINGILVHESHPGREILFLTRVRKASLGNKSEQQVQEQRQRDAAQWALNRPSLIVDIALGLLFFAVSKVTGNLTTAALVGAVAGLAVVLVQRFVKVDLLGGLAMFGVFTLLLSAGFSLWFQDERMVQLKGSILGVLVSSLILGDALFNRGRYFGARLARYLIGMTVDARRLSLGIAMLGLIMAGLNLLATQWLSKDAWLIYTTFVDAPLAMVLGLLVFRFARQAD